MTSHFYACVCQLAFIPLQSLWRQQPTTLCCSCRLSLSALLKQHKMLANVLSVADTLSVVKQRWHFLLNVLKCCYFLCKRGCVLNPCICSLCALLDIAQVFFCDFFLENTFYWSALQRTAFEKKNKILKVTCVWFPFKRDATIHRWLHYLYATLWFLKIRLLTQIQILIDPS